MVGAALLVLGQVAVAQSPPSPPSGQSVRSPLQERPRIGLVLSGGGARGAAHVGVVQVLEELRVPVDFIVGTSMGSIVGGLHASGKSGEELEAILTGVDWNAVMSNQRSRRTVSFRRREDDRDFQFRGTVRLEDRSVVIPAGAIDGRHVLSLFRSLALPTAMIKNFDDLPLPFRAIATDIRTGERVVLGSGDLALSMRASMSVPGVFSPVQLGDHLLVDGGLTDNLPIDVARTFQPDLLIAVDVGDTLHPLDEDSSALRVLNQMLTLLIGRESQRAAETLGPRDFLITPELEGIGSADFGRAADAITAGRAAALAVADPLRGLSLPEADYALYQRRLYRDPTVPIVDRVEIAHLEAIESRSLRKSLASHEGQPLDVDQLSDELDRLTGLDVFESVDYAIEHDEKGAVVLEILAKEPTTRSDLIRFHLGLTDDFQGDTTFGLGLRYSATQLTQHDLELRLDALLGDLQSLQAELYQPLPGDFFVAPRGGYRAERLPIFSDGDELAIFRIEGWSTILDVGRRFGHWGELRLGYQAWSGSAQEEVGDFDLGSLNFDQREAQLLMRIDTQDRSGFATEGTYLEASWTRIFEGLAENQDADYAEIAIHQAFSFGPHQVSLHVEGGTEFDEVNLYSPFELGGFLRLSGLAPFELGGKHKLLFASSLRRNIGGAALNMPTYLGLTLEAGNTWNQRDEVELDDLRWNGSLFLGVDSYLGPAFLGVGFDDGGGNRYYFSLGQSF